jgi:CRISPR/Cas system CSM-associated protein Csm3 (group 7 of RAMP superfamily)
MITLLALDLATRSPLAVTDPTAASTVDRPLIRAPNGSVYVPVTSLAGSLRAHLRAELGEDAMRSQMGYLDANDGGITSRLRLVDSQLSTDAAIQQRVQTAIDRARGAADARTLRTSEQIAAGATITLRARYDGRPPQDLLDALAKWQPMLGGGVTSGMGRCALQSLRYRVLDLRDRDDLTFWLTRNGPDLYADLRETRPVAVETHAADLVDAEFAIVDGLMIDGETCREDGRDVREISTTIASSSLKGVIRSQAEFILYSLAAGEGAPITHDTATQLVHQLFGTTEARGLLVFHDTEIENLEHANLRHHVAIDRLTGGARSGLLFAERPLVSGTFRLRIGTLGETPAWAEKLVWAILADLHDGYLGLGAQVTRGLGTVQLTDEASVRNAQDALRGLASVLAEAAGSFERNREQGDHRGET